MMGPGGFRLARPMGGPKTLPSAGDVSDLSVPGGGGDPMRRMLPGSSLTRAPQRPGGLSGDYGSRMAGSLARLGRTAPARSYGR